MNGKSHASKPFSTTRGCVGKRAHETWEEAEQHCLNLIEHNHNRGLPRRNMGIGAYLCPGCSKWHVGHNANRVEFR